MEQGSADTLDALETLVLARLRDDPDALDAEALRDFIRLAKHLTGPLYHEPAPIDPSEGRHSTAELHRLLDMLEGEKHEPRRPRARAGYTLAPTGLRPNEPGVYPAFVAALGSRTLRARFGDLWAVDALLWDKLETASPRELATLWLESPGRRLVQDLRVLDLMAAGGRLGATDFSPARIDAAVGLESITKDDVPAAFREHRELYAAVPGQVYRALWQPKPEPTQHAEQIVRALELLETGSPLGLRGAALRWLLDEAVKNPFYEVDGAHRDVREDLTLRLGTALRTWLAAPNENASQRLETLALQHAARFVEDDTSDLATKRAWAIARWLQGCLRRSPFYGGDEEVLAAHLEARLSKTPTVPEGADVLHPARFSVDDRGLNVAEISFLAAVIVHYEQSRELQLLPTPMPIVQALRRLASRPITEAEEAADVARLAGRNALGWPAKDPIIVPLAARRLMTELRIGWPGHVTEEAQIDTLERFRKDHDQFKWVAFAVHREGELLTPEARKKAVEVFRELAPQKPLKARVIATFASGILEDLNDDDSAQLILLAHESNINWRPFVLDALANAAFQNNRAELFQCCLEELCNLMADENQTPKTRLNAALFAVQRIAPTKAPQREALQKRIAEIVAARSFPEHPELRSTVRRFGVAVPSPGSKR